MRGTKLHDDLMEVVVGLIYHGRLFSASKDEVVIEKSINRIFEIMKGATPPEFGGWEGEV